MTVITPLLFFVAVSIALGAYCLLSLRTDGWRRWAGPGLLGVLLIGGCLTLAQAMGQPVPPWVMVYGLQGDIVGAYFVEDKAIYLWIVPPSGGNPVAVGLPWDLPSAKEIHGALEQGTPMEYDGNNYEKPVHPKPVEALPPKVIIP